MALSTTNPSGINYFGLWISALNVPNDVSFYSGGNLVESFDDAGLHAFVSGNGAYFGNPNPQFLGQVPGEIFAFVNFFDTGGTFDNVVFSGPGFESDNHTVGFFTSMSGTDFSVPEPASVALFLAGALGLACVRRLRRSGDLAPYAKSPVSH